MRHDYRGVIFYSANDLSIGWALEKAEKNIIEFEADERGDGGVMYECRLHRKQADTGQCRKPVA